MKLQGALFVNDRKEKESQPDYTGPISDESGAKFRVAAWKKEKNGRKYLSLVVSDLYKKEENKDGLPF